MTDTSNPFNGATGTSGPGSSPGGGATPTVTDLDKLFQIPGDYNGLPQFVNDPTAGAGGVGDLPLPGQSGPNVVAGIGDTSGMDTQALLTHLENLAPDELRIVQADLANAGYYGPIQKMSDEPTWGYLTTKDVTAMRAFVLDGIQAGQSGQTLDSLLARKTQQFSAIQSKGASTTPIFNLGKDYTVEHLDQTQVNSEADKAALAILGHGLTDAERAQIYGMADATHTTQQQTANAAAQARALSDATAKARLTIDPATGQPIAFNGIDATARTYLGKINYKWGGTDPATGLDCAGFTRFVYQQNGIDIGGGTTAQWANPAGVQVTADQAQPGDLVFFGSPTDNANAHVGIYVGNGMMIDNAHTGTATRVDSINGFGMPILGFKHFNIPGQPNSTPAGAGSGGFGSTGIGATGAGVPVDVGGFTVNPDAPAQDPNQAAAGGSTDGGPLTGNLAGDGQKPVISTPDTTTQTSQQDLSTQVAEAIRRMHPDEAAAHDFSNAYDQFLQFAGKA